MASAQLTAGMPGTTRLAWVDATRGYCVVAVVLFHVVLWNFHASPGVDPTAESVWDLVNAVLDSVRMPVLVTASGLVLARQVREGLGRRTTGFRSANNYYLYVVWLLVYAAFFAVLSHGYLRHRVDGLDVVTQLVVPETTLWYVYALAVYILVLALARRVPPVVILVSATIVSTAAHALRVWDIPGVADHFWPKVPEMFVFFAVGVYGAGVLRSLAERANGLLLLVTVAVAGTVTALNEVVDGPVGDSAFFVVRCLAFVAVSVVAASIGVRWAPVRRLGVGLGRRTLSVYVLHPLLIGLWMIATHTWAQGFMEDAVSQPWIALLYPIGVTAAIVAASIGLQVLLERAHLTALFEMPDALRRQFGRGNAPVSSTSPEPGVLAGDVRFTP